MLDDYAADNGKSFLMSQLKNIQTSFSFISLLTVNNTQPLEHAQSRPPLNIHGRDKQSEKRGEKQITY